SPAPGDGPGRGPAVALGADDVEDAGGHARSPGPKAPGSRSPTRVSLTGRSGPATSCRSWRQRPHVGTSRPLSSQTATAISRPLLAVWDADTTPHSAQRPTPAAAFSTLHPTTTCPSSISPAAPIRVSA